MIKDENDDVFIFFVVFQINKGIIIIKIR